MSKYTTEVRFICESYAGLDESVDYDHVEDVIENSYKKIFKTNEIPMFNGETEAHRAGLFKKILLHYYTREIGYETVGLWKLKLNQKLMEIMPYYNQLYESELIEFDPLKNINVTKTHEGEYNDDEKVDNIRDTEGHRGTSTSQDVDTTTNVGITTTDEQHKGVYTLQESDTSEDTTLRHTKTTTQGNDVRTNDIVSQGDSWTLFSDTPQGGLNGITEASGVDSVGNNSYLTNATRILTTPDEQSVTQTHGNIVEAYNADQDHVDNVDGHAEVETQTNETSNSETHTTEITTEHKDNEIQVTENTTGKITDDNTKNTTGTDEYEDKDIGKIGTETYSEMLEKFRKTFLNIDMMVINELEPLFIGLW